jgi:hypothetical protein
LKLLALQQQPGSPLFTTRYSFGADNGYIGLIGNGLFPRLPDFDFSPSLDAPKVPKDEDYPMGYYAKLPDLARVSGAAIDEIFQRESIFASISNKRFRIGLSFPGEKRAFVEPIAANLATKFGRTQILYDKFHEAEFARPELDVYLPNLYRTECDLIAVFLCTDYANKKFCRLEWRFIRQLIAPCIFLFVLLGRLSKESQAGVLRPVATGRRTVRVGTAAPRIRVVVMRSVARSARAHCPKLEPLLEHDNLKIIVARIPQV